METIKALLTKYLQEIIGKTKEIRENKNLLIFLVFVLLSTCFWVLNALRKDNYTAEVVFPVKFINVGDDQIVNGSLKRDLVLKIKGGGFKILHSQLKQPAALGIDISVLKRVSVDGVNGAYLNSRDYYKLIEGKLAVGLELLSVTPDTLFVPLIKKVSKTLPVKVDANFTFAQQCQLSGEISVSPDSVVVSGAGDIIDSLEYIYTKALTFEKLSDTIVRSVSLERVEHLEYKNKRVVVTFPVEPFTEANIMVPVKAINLPDSLELKMFPPEVNVSYHLGLSRPLHKASDFDAIIDFSNINLKQPPRRLKVKINGFPEKVQNMTYQPVFVEYLLEKRLRND